MTSTTSETIDTLDNQLENATDSPQPESENSSAYWVKSLQIVLVVLLGWASLSLVGGILLRDWLDSTLPKIGGSPFGFWIAQQGAIIGFLMLLVLYMTLMNRLDQQHGFAEGDDE